MVLVTPTLSSDNFNLTNPNTPQQTKEEWEQQCEKWRTKFIKEFIPDKEIPNWEIKAEIQISISNKEYGETTYNENPSKGGYKIKVSAKTVDSIQKCILHHEIMHSVFATYCNTTIPRWADEGYSTYIEPIKITNYVIHNETPFKIIMNQRDYPEDVSSFYGQSVQMVEWLVDLKGRIVFRNFVHEYVTTDVEWEPLLNKYYGFETYQEAQRQWKMRGLIINVSK